MTSLSGMFVQGSSLKAEIEQYQEKYASSKPLITTEVFFLEASDEMLETGARALSRHVGISSNCEKVWPDDFHYTQVVQIRAQANEVWYKMAKQYIKEQEAKCSKL
jgi:hypothetical protein